MGAPARRALSLRARLILVILVLTAVAIVVVGAASGFALRGFLVGQLDDKLTGAAERVDRPVDWPAPAPGQVGQPGQIGETGEVGIPPQGPGTLAVLVDPLGASASGRLDEDGETVVLTEEQLAPLLELAEDPTERTLSVRLPGLGDYRVVALGLRDGGTVIIGLPLADIDETVGQLWLIVGVIGGVVLAGAAALGVLLVRVAMRPLDRVVATATAVSRLPLDRDAALAVRVPDADVDERTEVGRVGASINRMLDHVGDALGSREASERTLRRFVSDASHELRTPLASIRGYSELVRRSGEAVPDPVGHALGRIESESVRMTGIVEDLLLLARLDEASPLGRADVDLTELLVTAVSDAQVAGPDHEWEVDVPEEPVVVTGDAARLHQVAMNLLANARRHTPPGTRVIGRLRTRAGTAVLEVEDDGPGIDPELQPSIFDRFVRGDASRARATGSTGLGLAIVRAVTTAHDGTAEVESVPGRTVFRITLPR